MKTAIVLCTVILALGFSACGRSVEDYTYAEWKALDEEQQWELFGQLNGHESLMLLTMNLGSPEDTINPKVTVAELIARFRVAMEEWKAKREKERAEKGKGDKEGARRSVEDYTYAEWEALDDEGQWELYGELDGHEAIMLFGQGIEFGMNHTRHFREDTINPKVTVGELIDRGRLKIEEQKAEWAKERAEKRKGDNGDA